MSTNQNKNQSLTIYLQYLIERFVSVRVAVITYYITYKHNKKESGCRTKKIRVRCSSHFEKLSKTI